MSQKLEASPYCKIPLFLQLTLLSVETDQITPSVCTLHKKLIPASIADHVISTGEKTLTAAR